MLFLSGCQLVQSAFYTLSRAIKEEKKNEAVVGGLGTKGEKEKVRQSKEGSKERESFLFVGFWFWFLRGKRPRAIGFVSVPFLARERKEPSFVFL